MAETQKRFILARASAWNAEGFDKSLYNDSIVFIHNGETNTTPGQCVAIYTKGVEYPVGKALSGETITKAFAGNGTVTYTTTGTKLDGTNANITALSFKQGDNITITVDETSALVITGKDWSQEITDAVAGVDTDFVKEVKESTINGSILVDGTPVAVHGLGSAAYTDSTAYDSAGAASTVKTELLGNAETYTTLGALEDAVEAMNAGAKSYTIKPVTEGLGANVETAYQLYEKVGETETAVGSLINIPKDDSLVNVEVTEDPTTGDKKVKFTYNLADGTAKEIELDLSDYVTEAEFGEGIKVTEGVASVKVKDGETYLKVDAEGLYTEDIDTTIANEIAKLDAEVTSTDGTKVQVKVTEVDGKITAVNVTEYDIASAQALADLTAEVTENEEVTAQALVDINGRLDDIDTTIGGLDFGVTSVKASTSSNHVTVAPTTDTKGVVELTVDVASVNATNTATYSATGLATDAYVNEKIASVNSAMNEAWEWGEI